MTTLLLIQAHPHTDVTSMSMEVGKEFLDSYRESHPDDKIIIRDLYAKEGVPPLNDMTMEAWRKQKFGEQLSKDEEKLLKQHADWLDEFIKADKYVFINPMYNHFLPAEMKQYLDLTAVAHKTFKYNSDGSSTGLLKNKKVLHIQSSGSEYHKDGTWANIKFILAKAVGKQPKTKCALQDVGSTYLNGMMSFYGIDNVEHLYVEGGDAHRDQRDQILSSAKAKARKIGQEF